MFARKILDDNGDAAAMNSWPRCANSFFFKRHRQLAGYRSRLYRARQKSSPPRKCANFSKNKCIGDDTIAAARQNPNCIKKYNMAKNDFQYGGWNYYTVQCGTIMTLISPGDCTMHCGIALES